MAREWRQLCNFKNFDLIGYIIASIVFFAVLSTSFLNLYVAINILILSLIVLSIIEKIQSKNSGNTVFWSLLGVIGIGSTGVALVWLRQIPQFGFEVVILFVIAIWLTDIFAFFVGRALRGPKLAPITSPNKTWAGLLGGIFVSAIWASLWSYGTGIGTIYSLFIIGIGIGLLGQLGDLSISVVKRKFLVKDTGKLIPGHGGALDRVDSFIGSAPIFALSVAISKGDLPIWS